MSIAAEKARLSTLQAAWVIARRDFVAVLFSRAFLFFLLGPLFPVIVGGLAGNIGGQVQQQVVSTQVGLAMTADDNAAMMAARDALAPQLGGALPALAAVETSGGDPAQADPKSLLNARKGGYAAIVSGNLDAPVLTGPEGQLNRWSGPVGMLAATAKGETPTDFPEVSRNSVATSAADIRGDRVRTAQGAQMLLFLLTMLLAGMVLSNLVEEKANKIIEVLAAAIPMDAVFLGKLFAMLGVSFVGISVWATVILSVVALGGGALPDLPAPAVGWPIFIALGLCYFATAYLLLGSIFLAVGAMAKTVREVQTLSMPATMLQLIVFFFAAFTVAQPESTASYAAMIFPFSSPFAMMAWAAQIDTLWPHAIALAWQAFAVAVGVKLGASLFRRRVMQSGGGGRKKRSGGLLRRRDAVPAE